MKSWIRAAEKCLNIKKSRAGENGINFSFEIFDKAGGEKTSLISAGKDAAVYTWETSEGAFLLAVSKGEKAGYGELQDRLEDVFDRLLGPEQTAELFAARYVVIDDMDGLEVCGGAPFEGTDTVFYGLYLSGGEEGYYFAGFGNAAAEVVFDELTGAARRFYRKPFPATILKGKSSSPIFNSLRSLAAEVLPDKQIDWGVLNTTFSITDGTAFGHPSVIAVYKGKATEYSPEELYDGKDFSEAVAAFLSNLESVYDISGFTVTNFKDGRYGATYYPADEEEYQENDASCGCDHNGNGEEMAEVSTEGYNPEKEDFADLDEVLRDFTIHLTNFFPSSWKHGMGIITVEDEYLLLSAFFSAGGSFERFDIKNDDEKESSGKINSLGEVLERHYPGWNAFAFSFDKGSAGEADAESIRDEAFNFDVFIDAEEECDEEDEYLLPIADLFREEFYSSDKCVSYVTFKIALGEDGLFVIEPATEGTEAGVLPVKTFDRYLPKIASITEDIFDDYEDSNIISVTIFPERKFGFYLEYADSPEILNRKNLGGILKKYSLSAYETMLLPYIKNELTGAAYEVEVESSLVPGSSKLGGSPDLPKGTPYPVDNEGRAFEFAVQINLEEIAPFDKEGILPKTGILSFFINKKTKNCLVLYFEGKDLETVSIPANVPFEEAGEYLPARLRFMPSLGLPAIVYDLPEDFFTSSKDAEKYMNMERDFKIYGPELKVKMFGYPYFAGKYQSETQNAVLLLRLPSVRESDMDWGEAGGAIYFFIDEKDLKERLFEKCFCVIGSAVVPG